jgi:signal transduction histidine kinase
MDLEKMKQVILNLLSNAIDFTPDEGRIEIVTSRGNDPTKKKTISIEVKDNGVGIPATNLEKIFDPYFTTKHKSRLHAGTGLGLFIAHQHVQEHKGILEASGSVDKGAAFTITIPAEPDQNLSDGCGTL